MNDPSLKQPDESLLEAALRVGQAASIADSTLPDGTKVENAIKAAVRVVAHDLRAMLHPELYPGYDPDHIYWDGHELEDDSGLPVPELPFQWSADTIEWVSTWAEQLTQELGSPPLVVSREDMVMFLVGAGWREGRDHLWRTDSFGGSWGLVKAYRRAQEELA